MTSRLFTIGHGARSLDNFAEALHERKITWVIDVRSVPVATYHTHYTREPLQQHLRDRDLRYLYLGDVLGGLGNDPRSTREDGADVALPERQPGFLRGIQRVVKAHELGLGVCLMCGEGRPHHCHRARLLGPALLAKGVPVHHILPDDSLLSQQDLDAATRGTQLGLF